MSEVRDTRGRLLRDLRISLTDRCNLRCSYCMPGEVFGRDFAFMERSELLSFEEIALVAAAAASIGVRKLRLTGGEPLLRRGIERLVGMLVDVPGIEDIALTTNGIALAAHADALAGAGLRRVTVSLDTLQERQFRALTGTRLPLARVLEGIDAALAAGLAPVKVNMVVRRGVNEGSLLAMAEHFRFRPCVLRFIEYMDVGETNGWRPEEVLPSAEVLRTIARRWPLEPLAPAVPGEVARRYAYRDGAGEIGIIASVTQPFCGECSRARLSAEGRLYTCLFATHGHDLRALLRGGGGPEELRVVLRSVWERRSDRYSELRGGRRLRASAESDPGTSGARERSPGRPVEPAAAVGRGEGGRIEMSYIGG